jgi:DNA-binding CsgD family transcriptional regulator
LAVRSFFEPAASASETGSLSAREMEILSLVAEDLANKEIGVRLHISSATMRTHLMRIYEKLHVRCRGEAAAKHLRASPVSVPPKPLHTA